MRARYLVIVICTLLFFMEAHASAKNICKNLFKSGSQIVKEVKLSERFVKVRKAKWSDIIKEEAPVFVVFESWGHAYLQVGKLRLDGHLLSPSTMSRESYEVNSGAIFHFNKVSKKTKEKLVNEMISLEGKTTLDCTFHVQRLLSEYLGLDFKNVKPLNISDFFTTLVNASISRELILVGPTSTAEKLQGRLIKSHERWAHALFPQMLSQHPNLLPEYWNSLSVSNKIRNVADRVFKAVGLNKSEGLDFIKYLAQTSHPFLKLPRDEVLSESNKILISNIEGSYEQAAGQHADNPKAWTRKPKHVDQIVEEILTNSDEYLGDIKGEIKQDRKLIAEVKEQISKYDGRHTQDVLSYIHRHLPKDLVSLMLTLNSAKIHVYDLSLERLLPQLENEGFTYLKLFPRAKVTDFDTLVAFNQQTNEVRFVFSALQGRASKLELLNLLAFYSQGRYGIDQRISLDRVKSFSSREPLINTFTKRIKDEALDPDIIIFGYESNMWEVLNAKGAKFIKLVNDGDFSGRLVEYKEKLIFFARVEPQFHGDRAGVLVRAFHRAYPKNRKVMMTGTAGAATHQYEVGSWVIPKKFSQVNQVEYMKYSKGGNELYKLNEKSFGFFKSPDIYFMDKMASVDSIMYENALWLQKLNLKTKATAVEQESFDLSLATKALGYEFYAAFRISDSLAKKHTFEATEKALEQDDFLFQMQDHILELLYR